MKSQTSSPRQQNTSATLSTPLSSLRVALSLLFFDERCRFFLPFFISLQSQPASDEIAVFHPDQRCVSVPDSPARPDMPNRTSLAKGLLPSRGLSHSDYPTSRSHTYGRELLRLFSMVSTQPQVQGRCRAANSHNPCPVYPCPARHQDSTGH